MYTHTPDLSFTFLEYMPMCIYEYKSNNSQAAQS